MELNTNNFYYIFKSSNYKILTFDYISIKFLYGFDSILGRRINLYLLNHLVQLISCFSAFIFSSFFASYDAMNEYCGDRNVYRKLSTVDGNDT